jgi:hypothetical protein
MAKKRGKASEQNVLQTSNGIWHFVKSLSFNFFLIFFCRIYMLLLLFVLDGCAIVMMNEFVKIFGECQLFN